MTKQVARGAVREDIYEYVFEKYNGVPEYPWMRLPLYAVFRRKDNRKWYAIIMNVPKNRLGLGSDEKTDIMCVKCGEALRCVLLSQKGFLPAYHLNRENWITVLLDGSADRETVFRLLDESYEAAKRKSKKPSGGVPTSWLVPANPKYYDVQKAFAESDTILWKQSSSVIAGDTVYLYLTAPYSCVMYKCEAVETDIPYEYDDGNVRMSRVMKIRRLHTYEEGMFGFAELKEHGIISVRGPRSVPYGLRFKLEKESGNGA